ncbi:DMT family transporter [Arenimonas oryziterrae]|uniref:DMT family transporter n=1 Tax=Arenimonas oryziterrae TaxID=498055 RepID=UPI0003B7A8ED|nr:DMT family transporter [Arenimonas oryziterrae]
MAADHRAGLGGRDLLLVGLICVAWAGNFLTSKLALAELPPLLFTALRLGVLAIALVGFLERPPAGQWPRLIAVALCNGVLHFGLSFWSLKLSTTIASPAIVMQSYVPMATLLAWWLLGERFHWRTGAAIALSFAGVLVLGFDPTVLQNPAALSLMLVSALFLGLGTVLLRGLKGMGPVSQQGWAALIGVGPLLAWSALAEPGGLEIARHASGVAWFGVAYAALVASLVGHGIYYVLMQRHPVAQVTPYLLATPLIATVLGIVVMDDRVGPRLWLGGAMVLGGVLVIGLRNLAKSRQPPPASEL